MDVSKRVKINTFPKFLMICILIHAFLLTTASYLLSWFGRDPVVSVSSVIAQEILAPVGIYLVTNMVANIFEKNKTIISEPLDHIDKEKKDEYCG